ncbi:sel1 repeat family protein [Ensifer sp. BR816]|uniref:sel1 repeat family protein n=1 Tax=Rhizobium sp. (strain BR816) TaxID=1057002 RepID=UPI000379F6EC|nr:sel1 repeat family protein [Ensifer sp. BR816]
MNTRIRPTNRIASHLATALLLSFAAIAAPAAHAADLTAADLCDREAGSELDLERNRTFPPVATEDIRIGVALSACREAYNQHGGARAQFQLARVLDRAGEKLKSLRILGEAAQNGHALAMAMYGTRLVERGETEAAFDLYQRAAAAGNVIAARNLAVAYRDGVGTRVDGALAAQWFERAKTDPLQ